MNLVCELSLPVRRICKTLLS